MQYLQNKFQLYYYTVSRVLLTVCKFVKLEFCNGETRAVPDLLLGNPAGAGCCRICKANPAGAGAGAGFHHKIGHQ